MHKTLTKLLLPICLCFLALTGCGRSSKTILVGASSTPHALILNETSSYISKQGYKLEVKVFNDYVLPNYALDNGELDANYFQHEPYLSEFNAANGTNLVSVLKVHFEPMGIYAGNKNNLSNYVSGDKIIVPSDKSNYDRAVNLLKENGINNANLVEVEAQNIPLMLSDCAFAVINGNYALSAGVVNRCLVTENKESESANKMANVIAVKRGYEENAKTRVLCDALKQENIKEFIKTKFGESVLYLL